MFESDDTAIRTTLTAWMSAFQYIHVALDTIVLYGVLREKNMDERAAGGSMLEPRSGRFDNKIRPAPTTPPLV